MEIEEDQQEIHVCGIQDGVLLYKKRWIMLALFVVYSLTNAYQWIHMNIIGNIMLQYYNESLPNDIHHKQMTIDWLANLYMSIYLPLIIPGMWFLNRYGLRVNIIFGALLNCMGAWIKCIGLAPDRFYMVMIGQFLCAVCNAFVVSFPPSLSAVWFGHDELSTATALGVFGNQIGVAVGFLLPPILIPNSDDLDTVGDNLSVMFYGGAAMCSIVFILIIIFFEKEPAIPPSKAQMLLLDETQSYNYRQSLARLLKQPSFVLLALSYGMITGVFYAISTFLNFIVLHYFKGEEMHAGRIGLVIVLAGIVASVVTGVWLDKTKAYKSTSVGIYVLSTLGMFAFTFTMDVGKIWIIYITAGALGFCMTGYLPVGYEFAAEITYPEPEGTSAGILTASAMFIGMTLVLCLRQLMLRIGVLGSNIVVSIILVVGSIMTMCVRANYLRQQAEHTSIKGNETTELQPKAQSDETNAMLDSITYIPQESAR